MAEKLTPARFIEGGRVLGRIDPAEYPILAAGLTEDKAIHVFSTQEAFLEWAKSTPYSAQIARMTTKAAEAKQYADSDTSSIQARQRTKLNRVREDMEAFARLSVYTRHPTSCF